MSAISWFDVLKFAPVVSFVLLLAAQYLFPRRDQAASGNGRIIHNLFLFVFNTVLTRGLVPISLLAVSAWAQSGGIGLLNNVSLPAPLAVVGAMLLLDLSIYWQHVATHKIPVLWRIHRVHHADHEMDVTTAVRFHPIELLLSLVFKSVVVIVIGAPALAIVLFELSLFVGPAFNHSNTKLSPRLDRVLRMVIATPDTHRSHHSIYIGEQNTNYGFFIIWWDKIFNTYTQVPRDGHQSMKIGLSEDAPDCSRLDKMLMDPFK